MLDVRFRQGVRFLSVAAFAALTALALTLPARADERSTAQAKRQPTSFQNATPSTVTAPQSHPGYDGFLYFPGAQPGMNIAGRVNVGKSHVYVPYYGNISNDPTHPGVSGTTGIAYGFRTWDISVLNGAFGNPQQPSLPGTDAPKVNPNLSFSIRF